LCFDWERWKCEFVSAEKEEMTRQKWSAILMTQFLASVVPRDLEGKTRNEGEKQGNKEGQLIKVYEMKMIICLTFANF